MKQDIVIYLLLPPLALIATTISISILPLLRIIDISAQLSQVKGSPPVIDYVLLMLIIYYTLVAAIIRDCENICTAKIKKLGLTVLAKEKSVYGEDTEMEVSQLMKSKEYQEFKGLIERGESKDKSGDVLEDKKRNIPINIFNENSDEDSERENELYSCHQFATSKKMF